MAWRTVAVVLTLLAWWWLMMAVHELGHVLGCWISGANIEAVILWPWTISQTVRSDSLAPLVDTWAGPVIGVVMPMILWAVLHRHRIGPWIGGWAGFCWIANGAYLGLGWIDAVGDAGDLVRLGVPWWVLAAIGTLGCGVGLWTWHVIVESRRRQDPHSTG